MAESGKKTMTEDELETLLDRAAASGPLPPDRLLAKVMTDADGLLASRGRSPVRAQTGMLGRALAALGGWPAVAGMASATVAGVWIGYAQPDPVGTVASGLGVVQTDYGVDDLMPDFGIVLAGG